MGRIIVICGRAAKELLDQQGFVLYSTQLAEYFRNHPEESGSIGKIVAGVHQFRNDISDLFGVNYLSYYYKLDQKGRCGESPRTTLPNEKSFFDQTQSRLVH